MDGIGTVFPNNGYGSRTYNILPSQVVTQTTQSASGQLINKLISTPAGQRILNYMLAQKSGWYKPILNNRSMSVSDKFKKIFGVPLAEVFPQASGLASLGNIFEDIGSWFSGGGAERFITQVENTSGEIGRILNALRNKPEFDPSQQMMSRDTQSQAFFGLQEIIDKYGLFIIGGLVLFLFLRK